MTTDETREIRDLLHDAVADIEPERGVGDVLSRVDSARRARNPWLLASAGAALATAATVAAVAALSGGPGTNRTDPGFAGSPSSSVGSSQSPSAPTPSRKPSASGSAIPVYFAGDTADGPGLYREFESVADPQPDALSAAVNLSVAGTAADPDYSSLWPAGTTVRATWVEGGTVMVDLLGDNLVDLPAGMDAAAANIALQQVVYTAQAVLQNRVPVQFLVNGSRVPTVLGEASAEPLTNAGVLATLAHVSLTTPEEGATVSGGTLKVSGVANSFEANVICGVLDGGHAFGDNPFTASGWQGDKLFPFEGTIDVSSIPAGTYTLVCSTDDPSGGAEGNGPDTDTRTITLP